LDESGAAKGSLYLDDGSSFAFLNGQYIDANITFGGGVLRYDPRHVGVRFTLAFERIVILGWRFTAPGAKYAAYIEGNGAALDVTREAVFGGTEAHALIVRNPRTPVSETWALSVQEVSA
jgi:hypothetical protein